MPERWWSDTRGVTLMEITVAVAIFAGVMAYTAQILLSYYVTIDLQEQRIEALQAARGVAHAIREKRAEYINPDRPNEEVFPGPLLTWINAKNEEGWTDFLRKHAVTLEGDGTAPRTELPEHALRVLVLDDEGEPVVANAQVNPIRVTVNSTWRDAQGRELNAQVVSLMSNR